MFPRPRENGSIRPAIASSAGSIRQPGESEGQDGKALEEEATGAVALGGLHEISDDMPAVVPCSPG